jgi:diadenosine tetraphosphate (Ap4A) HIT family hydrolase
MFQLHPQLAADCQLLGRFPLCLLLLLRDANYPWCVLVPARDDIREIHHLHVEDQQQLLRESVLLARTMEAVFAPHKMNVAALGNLVPQLHLHHVARYTDDPAWPAPVWGRVPAKPYGEGELAAVAQRLIAALPADAGFKPTSP